MGSGINTLTCTVLRHPCEHHQPTLHADKCSTNASKPMKTGNLYELTESLELYKFNEQQQDRLLDDTLSRRGHVCLYNDCSQGCAKTLTWTKKLKGKSKECDYDGGPRSTLCASTHGYSYAHTHTHARAHTHTHTHTLTHTHTVTLWHAHTDTHTT